MTTDLVHHSDAHWSKLSEAFAIFMEKAQSAVDRDYAAFQGQFGTENGPKLSYEEGRRYWRIVSTASGSRSAFAFVDQMTGQVLKAAGWKAPAKNFARGNIFDPQNGCGRIQWTGVQ